MRGNGAAPALAPALLSCEWMSYHRCFAAPGLLALLLVASLSAAGPIAISRADGRSTPPAAVSVPRHAHRARAHRRSAGGSHPLLHQRQLRARWQRDHLPHGEETRSTAVKWEGSALLINTLVSGSRDYTIMDRWKLSADHSTLTITRHVIRGTQQSEGTLIYRAEGSQHRRQLHAYRARADGAQAPLFAGADRPLALRQTSRFPPARTSRSRCVTRWTRNTRRKAIAFTWKPSIR